MNISRIFIILLIVILPFSLDAQCLSSVNPVGGTNNLLVLEKNSLRVISFYKYGGGNRYFNGNKSSDYNLTSSIKKAYYNYLSATIGYGLTSKLTLEAETGYFFNKTQEYKDESDPSLTGKGLSNIVLMAKHSIYSNIVNRFYITGSGGLKIPFSRELQWVHIGDTHKKLPDEVQPTMGAYGAVFGASVVKEYSISGIRYFLTSRFEANAPNKEDYKLGSSLYASLYASKHLISLKGDWTAILQLRNEIRGFDFDGDRKIEASGSNLFFIAPQLNYVLKEEWYISAMVDIPVYQYFNGIQLGASTGFTVILSKTFSL